LPTPLTRTAKDREWGASGTDGTDGAAADVPASLLLATDGSGNMSTAVLLDKFGTIAEFSRQLELFLTCSDEHKLFADKVPTDANRVPGTSTCAFSYVS